MKKSLLIGSMMAALVAVTGCASKNTPMQEPPTTAKASVEAVKAVPPEKLDAALCLMLTKAQGADVLNEAVKAGVASVMPDVQTFTDAKADVPEVCKSGFIMLYGLQAKEVKQPAAKGQKAKTVQVPENIVFLVVKDNKKMLQAQGPLKVENDKIELNQIASYAQEVTNVLLAKYRDGTLGKDIPAAAPAAK